MNLNFVASWTNGKYHFAQSFSESANINFLSIARKIEEMYEKDGWEATDISFFESKRKADEVARDWNETWKNDGRYGKPVDGKGKYAGEEQEESYRNKRRAVKENKKMRRISKRRAYRESTVRRTRKPMRKLREGLNKADTERFWDLLNYIHEDSAMLRWDVPDYDYDIKDYWDDSNGNPVTERDYNRLVKAYEELINNAKFYDGQLELSDERVLRKIESPVDEYEYMRIVDMFVDEFEKENDVEISLEGSRGRHVCVEPTLENLLRYDELVQAAEKKTDEMIDYINNLPDDE